MGLSKNVKMIDSDDWDNLIMETYDRPYNFQQQDDCKPRGIFKITIPLEYSDEYMNDSIPEVINGEIMGVKFSKWLERNPSQSVGEDSDQWCIDLFWERNFYPNVQMVANDLHSKGLIKAGDYIINIDW